MGLAAPVYPFVPTQNGAADFLVGIQAVGEVPFFDLCRDSWQFTRWTQRNQSDTVAVVGNRRAYWAWSEGCCATVCATLLSS